VTGEQVGRLLTPMGGQKASVDRLRRERRTKVRIMVGPRAGKSALERARRIDWLAAQVVTYIFKKGNLRR